jgi:hypothetical protein
MNPQTPEWLTRRNGCLRPASNGRTWYVMFGDQPQYALTPVPVGGKFGCEILQTNNGKRIPSSTVGATADEALRGGLDDLRKALGW